MPTKDGYKRINTDPAPGFHPEPTRFGFAYANRRSVSRWAGPQWNYTDRRLTAPLWPPTILLAILPAP